MAQLLQHLPNKHEVLTSDTQNPLGKQKILEMLGVYNLKDDEMVFKERYIPGAHWLLT